MRISQPVPPTVTTEDQAVLLRIRQSARSSSELWVEVWMWREEVTSWVIAAQRGVDGSVPPETPEWDQMLQTLFNAGHSAAERACCPF